MQIGSCEVLPERNLIRRGGHETHITPRSMDLLGILAGRPGEVVATDEIIAALWRADVSPPNAVHKAITELRRALGDDAADPQYIETVRKRGYRLVARVRQLAEVAVAVPPFALEGLADQDVETFGALRIETLARLGQDAALRVYEALPTDSRADVHLLAAKGLRRGEGLQLQVSLVRQSDRVTLHAATYQLDRDATTSNEAIASRLADAVRVRAHPVQRRRMEAAGARDVEAYLAVEAARPLVGLVNYQAQRHAIERLRKAISLDPYFLLAYGMLAVSLRSIRWYTPDDDAAIVEELEELALTVRSMAPGSDAERSIAAARASIGGELVQSEMQAFEAFKANRSTARIYLGYARLLGGAALSDEAVMYLKRAQELQPELPLWLQNAPEIILPLEGLERSLELRIQYLAHDPGDIGHLAAAVMTSARLGRTALAEEFLASLKHRDSVGIWSHATEAFMQALLGRLVPGMPAFETFMSKRRSGDLPKGEVWLICGNIDEGVGCWRRLEGRERQILSVELPTMESLFPPQVVADARYQTMLNEIGLGSEWREFLRRRVVDLAPHTGLMPPTAIRN